MIDELIDANGAGCELRSAKNDLIYFGRVYQSDGVSVSVMDATGRQVPPVIYNTEVKLIVRGLRRSKDAAPLVLFGKVCGSTRSFWKIDRLAPFNFDERREAFRQKVSLPARVLCMNSVYKPGWEKGPKRYPATQCKLEDVSMTGAMFASRETFEKGDWALLLDARFIKGALPFVFTCQIRRVDSRGARDFAYGCEFTHLSISERDRLVRTIFDIQREDIQGHRG